MGKIVDKLASMGESRRVAYLGNLRSLVSGSNIEQFQRYFGLLTDYDFIQEKINHPSYGVQLLIEDYELVDSSLFINSPEYAETSKNSYIFQSS